MDGQSYLLLIRDEGGPPEAQVGVPGMLSSHRFFFVLLHGSCPS